MQPHITRTLSGLDWRSLKIVLAVNQYQSIKRAAALLGVTESTVSRHVSSLEQSLDVCLFERTPGGMVPTDAGTFLIEELKDIEAKIEQGVTRALDSKDVPQGNVRITSVPCITNRLLIQHSASLLNRFPQISLDLIGLPNDLSMARREADIAIRLKRPERDLAALTRKVGTLHYGVYCSISRAKEGLKDEDRPWINYENEMSDLPPAKWIEGYVKQSGESVFALRFNDAEGLLGAVLQSHGKTLLPCIVADQNPNLMKLGGFGDLPEREVWLLVHPNLASIARVRAVIDWLSGIFSDQKPSVT